MMTFLSIFDLLSKLFLSSIVPRFAAKTPSLQLVPPSPPCLKKLLFLLLMRDKGLLIRKVSRDPVVTMDVASDGEKQVVVFSDIHNRPHVVTDTGFCFVRVLGLGK